MIEYYKKGDLEMAKKYLPMAMSISPKMIKKLMD